MFLELWCLFDNNLMIKQKKNLKYGKDKEQFSLMKVFM